MKNVIGLLAGAALILGGCLAALAQNAPASGQMPPQNEVSPNDCVTNAGDFRMSGKRPTFVTTLENKCERRVKCRVNVYVTTAMGPTRGQATLILAPHAAGEAAKKSYVLKVKMTSGTAQLARDCNMM